MIITCKKCETRFQVDASLLSPGGSKVRCSQCKYVFMAYPDKDQEINEIFAAPPDPSPGKEWKKALADSEQQSPGRATLHKSPQQISTQKDDSDELQEFSKYEQILDQPTRPDSTLSKPENNLTEEPIQKRPEPKTASASTQVPRGPQQPPVQKSSTEKVTPGLVPPLHHPRFKTRPAPIKRKKTSGKKFSTILLVVVFLVTAGAYIASLIMGYKIPWLSSAKLPGIENLLPGDRAEQKQDPIPVVEQTELTSRLVSNQAAGELFIITGIVKNPPNIAYHHIQIKGTLLREDGTRVVTKRSFCGNIIPDKMLQTGYLGDINSLLAVKIGMNGSNTNLKPDSTVPFMLVFSNLSETLANFTVEVEGFEKVDPQ